MRRIDSSSCQHMRLRLIGPNIFSDARHATGPSRRQPLAAPPLERTLPGVQLSVVGAPRWLMAQKLYVPTLLLGGQLYSLEFCLDLHISPQVCINMSMHRGMGAEW